MERLALILAALLTAGCSGEVGVPTHEVRPDDFVIWVRAEGLLRAVKTTSVSVPQELRRTGRLSWLAADGSRVEAGDLVARFDDGDMLERLDRVKSDLTQNRMKIEKAATEGVSRVAATEKDDRVAGL